VNIYSSLTDHGGLVVESLRILKSLDVQVPYMKWHRVCYLHITYNLHTSSFFSFFLAVLGLELRAYILSHSISPFCVRYFQDRVFRTISLGWLQTKILLISASWVSRSTGVSLWCLAPPCIFKSYLDYKLLNTDYSVNAMKIVVMLYCLGNNDKERKSVHTQYRGAFFFLIFWRSVK
jgi:hypothetical protein